MDCREALSMLDAPSARACEVDPHYVVSPGNAPGTPWILCVDGDATRRMELQRLLEPRYRVMAASDGGQALAIADSAPLALVIASPRMTGMDVIKFFSELRHRRPHARRVLSVDVAKPALLIDAVNRGQIFHCLTEPYDRSTVLSIAARAVGAHEFETSAEEQIVVVNKQNQSLRRVTNKLQQTSRAKSEFLASVSHEIRTPMTAILGYADLLQQNSDDPTMREGCIEVIRANGYHLLALINDILDLSKIEAGKLEVQRAPCSIRQMLHDVAKLARVRAAQKSLGVSIEVDELLPEEIVTDSLRLRQILINLLSNAIKFTDEGGVRLVARRIEKPTPQVLFEVIDTGVGVKQEQFGRLFEPFARLHESVEREREGTGLGLPISKRLAELLGGGMSVESTVGLGSTFRLAIPLEVPTPDDATADSASDGRPAPLAAHQDLPPNVEGSVLLVEDCIDNQRLIAHVLQQHGAKVTTAENGKVAIDIALEAARLGVPFDCILMDMQMPIMDGYEATRHLRSAGYHWPIIALTAHAMAGDSAKCIAAGCDYYVSKPLQLPLFLQVVSQWMDLARRGARKPTLIAVDDQTGNKPAPHNVVFSGDTTNPPATCSAS